MNSVTRLWPADGRKPAIEANEPPAYRHDHDDLREMAVSMLESRCARFPQLVRTGAMDSAAADAEIQTFRQIVQDWEFICTGRGQPACPSSLINRREALDSSIATIADIAAEQGGFSERLHHQAQCVIALRWHLEPGRQTILLARINQQLRADAAAQRKVTAHEAA